MADQLEPIHQAALDGDVSALNGLVQEDGTRLNAQVQGQACVDGWSAQGCTPLILAAYRGRDAVVARLLALGADVRARDFYRS